jgi:hypothetical protein
VALASDAAQIVVYRIRVSPRQVDWPGDPELPKVGGNGRADVWNVFESIDLTQFLFHWPAS